MVFITILNFLVIQNYIEKEILNIEELNPQIIFKDNFLVSRDEMIKIQDRAHRYCFIANSLYEDVEIKINI